MNTHTHTHTFVAMRVVSFNLLAHAYTKFNAVLHKQTDTREESAEQKHTRRARNAALIATLRPEVLLLQEHDLDVRVEGYARGVRALVDGRTEGCSVLWRRASPWIWVTARAGLPQRWGARGLCPRT